MATKTSHRLIMRKWLNCIFSMTNEVMRTIFGSSDHWMIVLPVHELYDQWPFCLDALATLDLKKDISFKVTEAV